MMTNEQIKQLVYECEALLLGKRRLKMFGILSYGMEKKILLPDEQNYPEDFPNIDSVMSVTDGKELTIIPRRDLTRGKMMYSILHQLIHIISKHMTRKGYKNEEIWNLACDHVTNKLIKSLAESNDQIEIPNNIVFFEDIDENYPEASAEDIYTILLNNSNQQPPSSQQQFQNSSGEDGGESSNEDEGNTNDNNNSGGDDGEDNQQDESSNDNRDDDGDDKDEEGSQNQNNSSNDHNSNKECKYSIECSEGPDGIKYIKITDNTTGKTSVTTNDTDLDRLSDEKAEAFEKSVEDMSNQAKTLWHSNEISKGDIPGQFAEYLNSLFRVEIPWPIVLENALIYPVQIRKRRSWVEPNFYVRKPIKLPGRCQQGKDYKKLIGCIDASASITLEELETFFGIMADSVTYYNGLIVLQHDVNVHKVTEYDKKPSQNQLIADLQQVTGRGGTSHKDLFNKITNILDNDSGVSTIMFLTDYYSDVQYIYKDYKWMEEYNTIWVLISNLDVKLDGCKTTVIKMSNLSK